MAAWRQTCVKRDIDMNLQGQSCQIVTFYNDVSEHFKRGLNFFVFSTIYIDATMKLCKMKFLFMVPVTPFKYRNTAFQPRANDKFSFRQIVGIRLKL